MDVGEVIGKREELGGGMDGRKSGEGVSDCGGGGDGRTMDFPCLDDMVGVEEGIVVATLDNSKDMASEHAGEVHVNAQPSEDEHLDVAELDDHGSSDFQPEILVVDDASHQSGDVPVVESAVSETKVSALVESSDHVRAVLRVDCGDRISVPKDAEINKAPSCAAEPIYETKVSAPDDCGVRMAVCQDVMVNDGSKESALEASKKTDVEDMEVSENIEHSVIDGIARLDTSLPGNDESSYHFSPDKENEFVISDLVWGKIKSHPWWPGQIVDPLNASEMALKYQRKDNFLVAYFGDKTFAWCDEFQLRPFRTFFSQMEKQSVSEVFLGAVDEALEEISRRIQLATICPCVPEQLYSRLKYQLVENAGIRKEVSISAFDRPLGMPAFFPSVFLASIKSLAIFPNRNIDKLVLSTVQSQMISFYRSKGFTRLNQAYFSGHKMAENYPEDFMSKEKKHTQEPHERSTAISKSPEQHMSSAVISRRGRPKTKGIVLHKQVNVSDDGRKQKSLSELIEDGKDAHLMNEDEKEEPKNKYSYKSAIRNGDMELKHSPTEINKSFKLGDCIRRVATKLIGVSSTTENNGQNNQKNAVPKFCLENDNPFSLDVSPPSSEEIQMIKTIFLEDSSALGTFLSQLYTVATNPIEKYDFISTTIIFFMEIQRLRDSIALNGLKSPGEVVRKRGRPRSVPNSTSNENVKPSNNIARKRGRPPKSLPQSSPIDERTVSQKTGRKRGRPRKVPNSNSTDDRKLPERTSCDEDMKILDPCSTIPKFHVQGGPKHTGDSCRTDRVIHENPERKKRGRKSKDESLRQNLTTQNLTKKSRPFMEPLKKVIVRAVPDSQHTWPTIVSCTRNLGLQSPRQIKYFGKKCKEESNPTSLILSFSHPDSVPSRTDLMRIFSRYGPLKEAEVSVTTKCATVVFKKQADAEAAFSSAGKCSVFGPSLLSYRLKNVPSVSEIPKVTPADGKHSTSVAGNTYDIPNYHNLEKHVPNLQLEDKRNGDNNVVNEDNFVPMDTCNINVTVADNDDMPYIGNLGVSSSMNTFQPSPENLEKRCQVSVNDCQSGRKKYVDRGYLSGLLIHGETSSGISWGVTDSMFDQSLADDDYHIDSVSKTVSIPMEICNIETQNSEKDFQPVEDEHLNIDDRKGNNVPLDGACLPSFPNKNDSAPINSLEDVTPATNTLFGHSRDSEVQDMLAEGPVGGGNIEVQADDALKPFTNPKVLGTEKDTVAVEDANFKNIDNRSHEITSIDGCLDEDVCEMDEDDKLTNDGNLKVVNVSQDETVMVSDNLHNCGHSEDPSGIDGGRPLSSGLRGSEVKVVDCKNIDVPSKKAIELADIFKADILLSEKAKSSEGDDLTVKNCIPHEASENVRITEASNCTKASVSEVCDVEIQGYNEKNTTGGSAVKILSGEPDQASNSGDLLGTIEEDPGSDCFLKHHKNESDASLCSFSTADVLGLKNDETSTNSGRTDHSESSDAKGNIVWDIGITKLPDGGNEFTLLYGAELGAVSIDDRPANCGNVVSVSKTDEAPKNDSDEQDLINQNISVNSTDNISETLICDAHAKVQDFGKVSHICGSPTERAEAESKD